ncbi:MAG: hypothetical protein HC779_01505 [Phyllobacteriaceae bacterium]|nr:hypothetical protein [Phyllobacteriaceae bacterium]
MGNEASGLMAILSKAGSGAVRIALLFGSAAVALSILLVPLAQQQVARSGIAPSGSDLDLIATGSTPMLNRVGAPTREYTIRRSVLQPAGEICVINANGIRTGSC